MPVFLNLWITPCQGLGICIFCVKIRIDKYIDFWHCKSKIIQLGGCIYLSSKRDLKKMLV